MDNENAYLQVFQFLGHPTLRPTALDLLLGVSTSDELVEAIKGNLQIVGSLCNFDNEPELKILVNISRDEVVAEEILKNLKNDLCLMIESGNEYFLMLLCNLSKLDACRSALVLHLPELANKLPDIHIQYILIELSRTGQIDVLKHIDATANDDFTFSVLKNLLFNVGNHDAIIEAVHFDNLAESTATPSVVLLEFLLLVGTTVSGRTKLRECNVYRMLKEAHLQSTDEEYRELIERVVELIVRDEEK